MAVSGMGKNKHNKKKDSAQPEGDGLVEQDVSAEGSLADAEVPEESTAVSLQNRLLRLQADFDNFRKRVARERSDTYLRANEELMAEIIPVLDHMDMALKSAAEHDAPPALLDGVNLVSDQLKGVLAKFGLEKIDASGSVFDPNEHEAIAHLPSGETAENMVMDQTRLGYKLKGRIIRPAQVVVSSGNVSELAAGDDQQVKG